MKPICIYFCLFSNAGWWWWMHMWRQNHERHFCETHQRRRSSLLEHGLFLQSLYWHRHESCGLLCVSYCLVSCVIQGLDGQSDPKSIHGGCEVLSGEKWSATKWMRQKATSWGTWKLYKLKEPQWLYIENVLESKIFDIPLFWPLNFIIYHLHTYWIWRCNHLSPNSNKSLVTIPLSHIHW